MEPIETASNGGIVLPAKIYNKLKWLVLIVLPAFSTFYMGLDAVVGVPAEEKVVGVSALVATLIGTLVGISSNNYNKSEERYFGEVRVSETEDGTVIHNMAFTNAPEERIGDKKELAIKVVHVDQ